MVDVAWLISVIDSLPWFTPSGFASKLAIRTAKNRHLSPAITSACAAKNKVRIHRQVVKLDVVIGHVDAHFSIRPIGSQCVQNC